MTVSQSRSTGVFFRIRGSKRYHGCRIVTPVLYSYATALVLSIMLITPALPHSVPNVLILDSYHHGYSWSDKEILGFMDRMSEVYPAIDPPVEHLDAKRLPGEDNLVRMKNILKEKYSGQKFDLVVAFDNPALELLIRYANELFTGTPIIFGGINDFTPALLQGRRDVTGVAETMDDKTTLETALKLNPNTKEVFVIHDYTSSGLAVRKELEKILPQFSDRVRFRFLPPTTLEEAVAEVRSLPRDSMGLILTYTTDRLGQSMSLAESTRMLTKYSPVPIYSMHETRLGHGIVGGQLIGGMEHGRKVADIALRVLSGEKPESIPVDMSGGSRPMFDYAQMKRFGIPSSALPAGSTVINKPESFYERYRALTISTVLVFVTLSLLVVGLAVSLRSLRRARNDLQKSEAKYRTFVDTANEGVWAMDGSYRTTFVNRRMAEMLGYSVEEMTGSPINAFFFEDDLSDHEKNMELRRQGKDQSYERRFRRKDGSALWTIVSATALKDLKGKFAGSFAMFSDITERKRMDEELRDSEERYRQLVEMSPDVIGIHQDGRIVFMNSPGARLFGAKSPDEIVGKTIQDVLHPDYRQVVAERLQRMLKREEGVFPAESLYVKLDGTVFPVEATASPLAFKGRPAVQVVARDITERKKAEDSLRESEALFRAFFEQAAVGVAQLDSLNGRFVRLNQRYCDIVGYTSEEMEQLTFQKITHPDDLEADLENMKLLLSGRIREFSMEKRYFHRDGSIIWVNLTVSPMWNEGEDPDFHIAVVEDITGRKKTEDALRESEQRYGAFLDSTTDLAFLKDSEFRYVMVNDANQSFFGKQRHEIIGKTDFQLMSQESAEQCRLSDLFAQKKNETVVSEEKQGTRTFETRKFPVKFVSGETGIGGFIRDITELRRVQEALKSSEERYKTVFENAALGIDLVDIEGRFLQVNPALAKMLGYSEEELLALAVHEITHPDDVQASGARPATMIRGQNDAYRFERRYRRKNGDYLWADVFVSPVLRPGGDHVATIGVVSDITEKKLADQRLRESEERFKTVADYNYDWEYWVDTDGNFLYISPSCERITGYTVQEFQEDPGLMENIIHPDDRPDVLAHFHTARKSEYGRAHGADFRIIRRDGQTVWIGHVCQPVYRPDGQPMGRRASNRDVTARKKAEVALAESELLYRTLFEGARDAIMLIDVEGDDTGRIVSANPTAAKIHGYSTEEFISLSLEDLETTDSVKGLPARVETVVSGELVRGEVEHRRKDGSIFPLEISASLLEISGHKYCIAIDRDISDRKLAEDALRQSEARVRTKLQSILSPEGDIGNLELSDVFDIRAIQTLMDHFYGISNITQALLDDSGNILAAAGWQDICTKFHRVHPETGMHCLESDTQLSGGIKAGSFKLYRCKNNMWDVATPIIIGGKHLGNLFLGQFLFDDETPDYEVFTSQALRYGFDEQEYLAALERVPRFSKNLVQSIMVFYAQLAELLSTLSYSNIKLAKSLAEQERLFNQLRESEERYRAVVDNLQVGISVINRNMEIEAINPFFGRYYPDVKPGAGQLCYQVYNDPPGSKVCGYCPVIRTFEDGQVHESETDTPTGGEIRHYRIISCPVKNEQGEADMAIELVEDVTERRSLYAQLAQAQKMEAVGTLAGGVAHDFNNVLQVALGYSEILLDDSEVPQRCRVDLEKINESAKRGADLVQRLLTFSRKTEINLQPLDLNSRITDLQKMLERTLPKMVDIQLVLDAKLAKINADKTQIDQILMNLAVNARDAMPEGGKLLFETANVLIDQEYARTHLEAHPGLHVLLMVTDTGSGMDKDTLEHIFEPFYTTKGVGEGTGLGLAMVHGIVKNHGGTIMCYSEPGEGTTFRIYFPALVAVEDQVEMAERPMPRGGSETILLVDDEEFVRDIGSRNLGKAGYKLITAPNGKEALEVYEQRGSEIDLVLLDLMMPEMGGKQCLEGLLSLNPSVRVIIASGFSANGPTKDALSAGAKAFVNKPYDMRQVLEVVRNVLEAD